MRKELPENVAADMKRYRLLDYAGVPPSYIVFHKTLAREAIEDLKYRGYKVVSTEPLVNDGWFDGFRTTEVIVLDPEGIPHRLKWHAGNQGWMEKCKGGGWGIFYP